MQNAQLPAEIFCETVFVPEQPGEKTAAMWWNVGGRVGFRVRRAKFDFH